MTRREVRTLPSGATLVAEVRPDAPGASAGWFVPVGSRDEPADRAGVSHFLEHLAFKGTDALGADDLNRRLDALGARANAFTGEDRTGYYGSVLPENLAALDDLFAAMLRPAFRPDDVDLERNVILEEIAMAHDEPTGRVADAVAAAAFGDHPLGRPILGTAASVAALDADALRAWCHARYRADALVIVVTGRFDLDATADRLAEATAALAQDAPSRGEADTARTPPTFRPGAHRQADRGVRRVYGATLAPGVAFVDPRRTAALLTAKVLGEPGHGALHWALVDPGLADDAGLIHEPGDGFGAYAGWFETSVRHEARVVATYREVLDAAMDAPIDPDAWTRAQRTLATDLALQAETGMGRVMALADAWLERGELDDPAAAVAEVLATGPEAGEALLEEHPFDATTLELLGPPPQRAAATEDA